MGVFVSVAHAYDFVSGGIYYNITSTTNMTASVTYFSKTNNAYRGTVTIPAFVSHDGKDYTVTAIGEYAFVGCTSLEKVEFTSDHLKTIGNYAFSGCNGMKNVVIPTQITNIGNGAFNGCYSITGVTIEESDETLKLGCNYYTNTGTGKGLFYDCPLYSVFIGRPLSYTTTNPGYYGYSPFANITTIETANLGNLVKSVQGYLFYGCKSIVDGDGIIPSTVTSIGERAFFGCAKLKTITIPNKVKSIGQYGFANCTELVRITSLATTPPSINANCFSEDTYNNASLIVHNAYAYGQAVGWKLFQNVDESGVVTEITDVQTDAPKITVFNGIIHAEGLDMKVYNMSGYLIGEGSEVSVAPGLYIVKVGEKSFKVQIKL